MTVGPLQHDTKAVAASVGTLIAAAAAIVALHAFGDDPAFAVAWGDLWNWLSEHGPERTLLAFGRVFGLALSYWIAGSLLLATAASATHRPALVSASERFALPALRRLAERAVAVTISVASLTGGSVGWAGATEPPPSGTEPNAAVRPHELEQNGHVRYVPVPAGDAPILPTPTEEETEPTYVPTPAGTPMPAPTLSDPLLLVPAPRPLDPAAADAPSELVRSASHSYDYAVVTGDNLWTIAETHLGKVLDRTPAEHETATYWSHLIETNRMRIRSGDPDLIYPGELIECPPASDVGLGR